MSIRAAPRQRIMNFLVEHLPWSTLVVIVAVVCVAPLVFWITHRLFPDKPIASPAAGALVNIVLAVLVGFWLNNLWAVRRDRDGRLWSLRQKHLERLRSTFRAEADAMKTVATNFHLQAFMDDGLGFPALDVGRVLDLTASEILSSDVENHYPAFTSAKRELAERVASHDQKFAETLALAERELSVGPTSWFLPRTAALTFIEQRLGKGPGLVLQTSADRYSLTYWAASSNSPGAPERALVSVYRRYKAFRPSSALGVRLQGLQASSDGIEQHARQLSNEALLMAERTALPGSCVFVQVPRDP